VQKVTLQAHDLHTVQNVTPPPHDLHTVQKVIWTAGGRERIQSRAVPTAKRERQRANRAAKLAALEADYRSRRNRRWAVQSAAGLGVVAVIGGLVWFGGREAPTETTTATPDTTTPTIEVGPADYAGFRAQPTACGGEQPPEVSPVTFPEPADQALTGAVDVTIATSCGPIRMTLDPAASPQTVNSFVFLAREGYFDGTACHRLVEGFVLQCGDPTATGTGGPGYTLPDEFPEEGFVYEQGVVAMANSGPGTTGSQFFIVTGDASALGPEFSILGTVVGSAETLAAVAEIPLGLAGREVSAPLETIYVESVAITPAG
jgi:peptidyl-prolyl cis-trans isomerase B (cyclophilin B)